MADSSWDAAAAIVSCSVESWSGVVWRCHSRKYGADDASGSCKVSGRFNRGRDKFPVEITWMALYTNLAPHVALGERLRHTSRETLQKLANQRMSRLRVNLQQVLIACAAAGCAQLGIPGLNESDLCHAADYEKTHALALAARAVAEAFLVPSCTKFPEGNLIVFPDRLLPGSSISVEESVDPELYIDWDTVQ